MDNELYNKLIGDISELRSKTIENNSKKLDLELLGRIIDRLNSFQCQVCEKYMAEIYNQVSGFNQKNGRLSKEEIKNYRNLINNITSHLHKGHKLVTKGYYTGTYMSLGISIGMIFGLSVFDNLALGLPIGLSIGLSIGAAKDNEAAKSGLVI